MDRPLPDSAACCSQLAARYLRKAFKKVLDSMKVVFLNALQEGGAARAALRLLKGLQGPIVAAVRDGHQYLGRTNRRRPVESECDLQRRRWQSAMQQGRWTPIHAVGAGGSRVCPLRQRPASGLLQCHEWIGNLEQ